MVLLGVTELGVNLPSLVAYLVNFILLLGILGVFAYKPLMRMLDERTELIRESLEAADLARQEAANAQEAIQEQITEARREGQRIMDQTREAAERFRTEEMDKARQEAEAFVERAKADIARERDTALQEVRASFGDLAITAAERVIRSSLDRTAHESLIKQVLEEGESLRRG